MNIEGFIDIIEKEFFDMPKGILKAESNYKEVIGLTSINALILIALIDNAFDVILSAEDIKTAGTLENLFEIIKKK